MLAQHKTSIGDKLLMVTEFDHEVAFDLWPRVLSVVAPAMSAMSGNKSEAMSEAFSALSRVGSWRLFCDLLAGSTVTVPNDKIYQLSNAKDIQRALTKDEVVAAAMFALGVNFSDFFAKAVTHIANGAAALLPKVATDL